MKKNDAPFGLTKRGTPRKRAPREGEGNPPHVPTPESRKQVEAMCGYGIPHDDIAKVLGVCDDTLVKHYPRELETGHVKANAKVVERLWKRAAEDGDTTACIWWTKSRMRWSEKHEHEHKHTHEHSHTFVDEFASRIAGIASRIAEEEGARPTNGSGGPPVTN